MQQFKTYLSKNIILNSIANSLQLKCDVAVLKNKTYITAELGFTDDDDTALNTIFVHAVTQVMTSKEDIALLLPETPCKIIYSATILDHKICTDNFIKVYSHFTQHCPVTGGFPAFPLIETDMFDQINEMLSMFTAFLLQTMDEDDWSYCKLTRNSNHMWDIQFFNNTDEIEKTMNPE